MYAWYYNMYQLIDIHIYNTDVIQIHNINILMCIY